MRKGTILSIVWLLGLAYLFLTDRLWPWILILIVLSIAISGFMKNEDNKINKPVIDQIPDPIRPPAPQPPVVQAATPIPPAEEVIQAVAPKLPATCPACGAPLGNLFREEGWSNKHSYDCGYCGAHIPLKDMQ